jgi:hypothetical protein
MAKTCQKFNLQKKEGRGFLKAFAILPPIGREAKAFTKKAILQNI